MEVAVAVGVCKRLRLCQTGARRQQIHNESLATTFVVVCFFALE